MNNQENKKKKTDPKCKNYIHKHCLLTINQKTHTRIAMLCDMEANYCSRKIG